MLSTNTANEKRPLLRSASLKDVGPFFPTLKKFGRFLQDVQAVSAKKKVTKGILKTQEYFERIWEETSSNLAAKLTPREKNQITSHLKRRFMSVQNKIAPV